MSKEGRVLKKVACLSDLYSNHAGDPDHNDNLNVRRRARRPGYKEHVTVQTKEGEE